MDLGAYDYTFPKKLVAMKPASPRDKARLLVFDRGLGELTDSTFFALPKFLPKNSVLVFNQTKVLPARMKLKKSTGGEVEVLFTQPEGQVLGLANKRLNLGDILSGPDKSTFEVTGKEGQEYSFLFRGTKKLVELLKKNGVMPLPPYLKDSKLSRAQLLEQYQTVFAKTEGSVAAPTAGLHFTKRLMDKLKRKGIQIEYVTLHVGLGTFARVTEENLKTRKLHKESYEISPAVAKRLNQARKAGCQIFAVGTTSVRTLESASNARGELKKLKGETQLFIQPPYRMKFISGLITNFHVPKSSLLMLVASLVGREKLLALYTYAVKKKYRLFSFGDGMLVK